jgi:PAS domain S-box-containing protein
MRMVFGKDGGDLFRQAVEASPAAMIVSGVDGLIQFANAETERMFGYSTDELVGQPIDILVPNSMRSGHKFLRRDFFDNPSKRVMGIGRDVKAVRRDASEFPVEIGLTPIETEEGVAVLATVLDTTPRREAEAALAQRASELERANRRLAQFAYVASHDLQEPLRKIAAFSDLLEQAILEPNPSEMAHAKQVIRSSALRARALVDDLLSYSKTVNDAQQLQALDLRAEIDAALEDLSEMIAETCAEVDVDAPHAQFEADRSQFARLVQNIVSNAIKYRAPNRTAKVRIVVGQLRDGVARLAFVDNGIGFEPKYAAIIFEPFKRLHPQAEFPGTGIGLAICKSIADRRHWGIGATSEPGEGSVFYVTIPLFSDAESRLGCGNRHLSD